MGGEVRGLIVTWLIICRWRHCQKLKVAYKIMKLAAKCPWAAVYIMYFGRVNIHTCSFPHKNSCPVRSGPSPGWMTRITSCSHRHALVRWVQPTCSHQYRPVTKLKFLTLIAHCIILVDGLKKVPKSIKMHKWVAKLTFAAVWYN